jgi:NADPH:quinone reductase-like Zn-dependent oxidoreductase
LGNREGSGILDRRNMRAIRLHEFGTISGLKVEELDTPTPGAGEVLVRVAAASVNASDVKNVRGLMHQTRLPRVPGRDFAGTVVAGSGEVIGEMIGREVWGTGGDLGFTRDGTHATHVVIAAEALVARPAGLSAEAAACSGVTFVTAAYGLSEANIAAGQSVVIIGVFGGVGRAAAQIAKRRGARVIGISRGAAPVNRPASMADVALIDSSQEEVAGAVKKLTDGRGADIVFDTVGGAMLLEALKYLAPRGRIIEISAGREANVTINLRDFYHQQARLIGVDSLSLDAVACAAILRDLNGGFENGELTPPPIAERYKLDDAQRAYEAVEGGKGEGRHVLLPGG